MSRENCPSCWISMAMWRKIPWPTFLSFATACSGRRRRGTSSKGLPANPSSSSHRDWGSPLKSETSPFMTSPRPRNLPHLQCLLRRARSGVEGFYAKPSASRSRYKTNHGGLCRRDGVRFFAAPGWPIAPGCRLTSRSSLTGSEMGHSPRSVRTSRYTARASLTAGMPA